MSRTNLFAISFAISVAVLVMAFAGRSSAQASADLTGVVSSEAEGPLEGVVVSAKRAGSTITVSVMTDAQGRYALPANRLEPGAYTNRVRATGYDLDGPSTVDVAAGRGARLDLKLREDEGSRRAAHQWRMVLELAGHPPDEERLAQLHAVPHARTRRAQHAQRGAVGAGAPADGTLRAGKHA